MFFYLLVWRKLQYKSKVKLVKWVLGSIFVLSILIFICGPFIYMRIFTSKAALAQVILANIIKKEIKPPILSGTTDTGNTYYFSADKVTNNIFNFNKLDKTNVVLTKPYLLYSTTGGLVLNVNSKDAVFDSKTKKAYLQNTLELESNFNHKAKLSKVYIDFPSASLYTNEPVIGSYRNLQFKADALEIKSQGNVVIFKGKVTLKSQNKRGYRAKGN